jgi:hypothetical protein
MLNVFSKTKSWMVASLLVATSVYAQQNGGAPANTGAPKSCAPCVKVCPPDNKVALSPAYNASAAINTRCSWDLEINSSFLYWQAFQDNMELGVASTVSSEVASSSGFKGKFVNMDFDFKPAFRVGLGLAFDHDDWDMQAQYTWFHANNRKTATATAGTYIVPSLGLVTNNVNQANSISQKWHLKMDIADLNLGRAYYVGKNLTMRPSFGARAAFIRQHMRNTIAGLSVIDNETSVGTESGIQKSHSWGVGTVAGVESKWLFCDGFRLFGNGSADLLFTRYTKLSTKSRLSYQPDFEQNIRQRTVNTMRTHLDLAAGIGYGTYFDCNNWYFDLSAGYEFQVFFDQNMFREYGVSGALSNSTNPNGNLYLQGLTVKAALDF